MPCIPLYDTLGENAIVYIIKHAEISTVLVFGAKLPDLVKALPGTEGLVKNVIYWGEADDTKLQVS